MKRLISLLLILATTLGMTSCVIEIDNGKAPGGVEDDSADSASQTVTENSSHDTVPDSDTVMDSSSDTDYDVGGNEEDPSESSVTEPSPVVRPTVYDRALDYIAKGDHLSAYNLLLTVKNETRAQEMLADFVFLYETKEETIKSQSVSTGREYTPITRTYKYTYDSNGNKTKYVYYYQNELSSTDEYTYDSNGNMTKREHTNSSGDTTYSYVYTYDSKGNRTKIVYTYSDGSKTTYEYTYDSRDNVTKEVRTDKKGSRTTYEYTYDSRANLTKEVYTYSDGSKTTTEYTYDSHGNVVKETTGNTTTKYTYDINNCLIKEEKTTTGSSFIDVTTTVYEGYRVFYRPTN